MTRGKYIRTPEINLKSSLAQKGKKISDEMKKKISIANKGKIISSETRLKMSLASKGKKQTPEHTKKVADKRRGMKLSKETCLKMSESRKGNKNPNWRGGIDSDGYSIDWCETLKRSIRERDYYVCRICGKPQGDIAHDVHHIDYDKKNCSPDNLITLCHVCHVKTNYKRDYWKQYFHILIN